ncbi:hypothetical protein SAMN02744784_04281 [Stenotrophomonas sp. CC120223-11]|nr:hypothetical protein SAMN02744784_04281 [Stenotrophomonas sp. CC120223-11]
MIDIPTGTASGVNNKGNRHYSGTIATGVSNSGTVIVGNLRLDEPIYLIEGSPPRRMGHLRGGSSGTVSAVSGNGVIAVGEGDVAGGMSHAFNWRSGRSPEMEDLGVPDGYDDSYANDVCLLAGFIVGHCFHSENHEGRPFRWINSQPSELSRPQESFDCAALGVNENGNTIVGVCHLNNGYYHAVCWLGHTTEVTTLPCLGEHSNAYASAVSGDGNVIVGYSTEPYKPNLWHAVRWTRNPNTNTFNISNLNVRPEPPQDTWEAHAYGVSRDGTVIVGVCYSVHSGVRISEAFIWREDATPQVQKLPDITQGYKNSTACDVTKKNNGTIIAVGQSVFQEGNQAAVRWTSTSNPNEFSIGNLNFPS